MTKNVGLKKANRETRTRVARLGGRASKNKSVVKRLKVGDEVSVGIGDGDIIEIRRDHMLVEFSGGERQWYRYK